MKTKEINKVLELAREEGKANIEDFNDDILQFSVNDIKDFLGELNNEI